MAQEEQEEMSPYKRNLSAVDSFGGDQIGRSMSIIGEDPEGEDRKDTIYSKREFENQDNNASPRDIEEEKIKDNSSSKKKL